MLLNKLASIIAKKEGKKHQASIGDIREILKIIVDDNRLFNGLHSIGVVKSFKAIHPNLMIKKIDTVTDIITDDDCQDNKKVRKKK